ncbi:hypothetical protein [Psychrobacter sp. I-STPA10]|uniref:hypothetical protein n=1 Tax=Psychrobacter sp. I-STPA10 TaxID=2585769 RepID=UPI001E3C42D7|nr:hypothetical protein [Psychrobacter sp. I-STPA10]
MINSQPRRPAVIKAGLCMLAVAMPLAFSSANANTNNTNTANPTSTTTTSNLTPAEIQQIAQLRQQLDALPATTNPIEEEARSLFAFLLNNEPQGEIAFKTVYGTALKQKYPDFSEQKILRYCTMAVREYLMEDIIGVGKTQFFIPSLLTAEQRASIDAQMLTNGDKTNDILGRYDREMLGDISVYDTIDQHRQAIEQHNRNAEQNRQDIRETEAFLERMGWD